MLLKSKITQHSTEYLKHNDFEHATLAIESATHDQIKVFSLAEIARKYGELDNRVLALKTLATCISDLSGSDGGELNSSCPII